MDQFPSLSTSLGSKQFPHAPACAGSCTHAAHQTHPYSTGLALNSCSKTLPCMLSLFLRDLSPLSGCHLALLSLPEPGLQVTMVTSNCTRNIILTSKVMERILQKVSLLCDFLTPYLNLTHRVTLTTRSHKDANKRNQKMSSNAYRGFFIIFFFLSIENPHVAKCLSGILRGVNSVSKDCLSSPPTPQA